MAKTLIGYYADWKYYHNNAHKAHNLPDSFFQKYKQLNYAFLDYIEGGDGSLRGIDDFSMPQNLFGEFDYNPPAGAAPRKYLSQSGAWKSGHFKNNGIIDRMHAHGGRVVASIGGWSMSPGMPQLFDDEQRRANFAEACKQLIIQGEFDGIDIDWEYPGKQWVDATIYQPKHGTEHTPTPRDAANFLDLMKKIRAKLDEAEAELNDGRHLILSSCFSADPSLCDYGDMTELEPYLDSFNIMTYDMAGAFPTLYDGENKSRLTAGHHTCLRDTQWGPWSAEEAVQDFLALGVPADKIVIGSAFYGRAVKDAQAPGAEHDGVDTSWNGTDGMPQYLQILQNTDSVEYWDEEAGAPYRVKPSGFVSYDNERSCFEKGEYVTAQGLYGIIVWETSGEVDASYNFPLSTKLIEGFESNAVYHTISVTQPEHASISPSAKTIAEGGSQVFTITADVGYLVDKLIIDGVAQEVTDERSVSHTFANVTQDHTIGAVIKDDPTVYYMVSTLGSNVNFDPANPSVEAGKSITVNITAADGYAITDVSLNGSSQGAVSSVTLSSISQNHTIQVSTEATYPTWDLNTVYTGGDIVAWQGAVYKAKWWTQGNQPDQNTGSGLPWEVLTVTADTTPPQLTLIPGPQGTVDMELNLGETYVEPGFSASDDRDGNLTGKVQVSLEVDVNVPGVYTNTYSVSDDAGNFVSKTRTVTVTDVVDMSPSLTLVGGDMSLMEGDVYTEPGYSAETYLGEDITSEVEVLGTIDTSTPGEYVISYSIESEGITVSKTRKVTIEAEGGLCTDVPVWDAATPWTSYSLGDRRVNAGQLWECTNVGFSYHEPSGPYGHYGWVKVGNC